MMNNFPKPKNILIYGAGEAGKQLAVSLDKNLKFKIIGFLDDDKRLSKKKILGKTVHSLKNLRHLIKNKNISHVFLAIPSISRAKRNEIIKKLNTLS
jgi:FlaA1/EpsC-like NDP-sugar epimerase